MQKAKIFKCKLCQDTTEPCYILVEEKALFPEACPYGFGDEDFVEVDNITEYEVKNVKN